MDKKTKPLLTGKIPIDEPQIRVQVPNLEKYIAAGYEVYAVGSDILIDQDITVLDIDIVCTLPEPIVLLCLSSHYSALETLLYKSKPMMDHMHLVKLHPEINITYLKF